MTTAGVHRIPSARGDISMAAIAIFVFCATSGILYWNGIVDMVAAWSREEYSYGYIVPFIAAFLFIRGLPHAEEAPVKGQLWGIAIATFALLLGLASNLSRIPDLSQYGLFFAIVAALTAHIGVRRAARLWVPIVYLAFMIPLPQVVYLKLTAGMQLVSSELGVAFIQLINVPVYLEGNVIDLGIYKLQVSEACSGLRYMFPLMSFGFLVAVLYRGAIWQRVVLFLSTVPITILMNGLRVGVIGLLVDAYGIEQAEGFLHFFEGWVIFGGCVAVLFLEGWLFLRFSRSSLRLRDALDLEPGTLAPVARFLERRDRPGLLVVTLAILGVGALMVLSNPLERTRTAVARLPLVAFPLNLDDWRGRSQVLEPEIVEVLGADDYLMANYANPTAAAPVNLFISYYNDQTGGEAVHSPEVCIPGDGWEIRKLDSVLVGLGDNHTQRFRLARAVIQKGLDEALVYFWFEQRGRQLTNEYRTKWYILWDGLTIRRTDGGLVRLITPILKHEGEAGADARLQRFLGTIYPLIESHMPEAPDRV